MEGSSTPWVGIFLHFLIIFSIFIIWSQKAHQHLIFFMSTLYWPLLSFHVKIIKNWDLHLVSVPCKGSLVKKFFDIFTSAFLFLLSAPPGVVAPKFFTFLRTLLYSEYVEVAMAVRICVIKFDFYFTQKCNRFLPGLRNRSRTFISAQHAMNFHQVFAIGLVQ